MKVSKRDISILLIVLGLLGAFSVFQFYFRGALKDKEKYEKESTELQTRLDKYLGVDENAVIAEMAKNREELETKASVYPAAYLYEDIIMYMNEWQSLPYDKIYTEIYNFPEYTIEETDVTEAYGGVLDWDQAKREPIEVNYTFSKATLEANYGTNSYKGFKDMINKIYLDPKPKTVSSLTALFDASNGFIEGAIGIDFLNVQNGANTYDPVKIKDVKTGIPNMFGPTYTPTPTPTPTEDPKAMQKQNQDHDHH
jgi:hypothetical protein